ncbi:MAG TPA: hypothetical protein VKY36_06220 [Moheibacter sp.]|nr:hypothetical protein [Moheibacter sp.]
MRILNTDAEKAFVEAKKIEKEAQRIKAREAGLVAIEIKYRYLKMILKI